MKYIKCLKFLGVMLSEGLKKANADVVDYT